MQRVRNFCFTINNYTDDDLKIFKEEKFIKQVKYYIYEPETGEQGTNHIQGFIIFNSAKTIQQVSKHLKRAHLEITKGNLEQNIKYCSKEGKQIEYGEAPKQSGKRTDIDYVKQAVLNNTPINEMLTNITGYQQLKYMEGLLKYAPPPEPEKKTIKWYYGEAGAGKTKRAMEEAPKNDYYISMGNLKWWDGYTGQSFVILDDFRKDSCSFNQLLRILDRYPYRVETKGSSQWLRAKTIIITAPITPQEMYDSMESAQLKQLIRRIDEITAFNL